MQKSYCDVCDKEIEPSELRGGFLQYKEVYPVTAPNPFGQKEQFQARKEIQPEVSDLCQACTAKASEVLEMLGTEKRKEKLKAEVKNNK